MTGTDSRTVIGVFDSGVGGLTVVRRIWEMLPEEPVLFVADQEHVPYGGRQLAEVAGFARGISGALIRDAGVTAVVMACNISTATALESVRCANSEICVLGVIAPGAKAAVRCTTASSIGVLATQGTVSTGAYTRTLHTLDGEGETGRRGDGERERRGEGDYSRSIRACYKQLKVTEVACPDFVPLIESEQTESVDAFDAANRYLAPIIRAGADVVILGCTHYPFLLPCLRRVAPHLQFIDPAEETVCELIQILPSHESRAPSISGPVHTLYTTGDPEVFAQQISFFLPKASPGLIMRQAEWRGGRLWLQTA